ncbi:MAG TPA: acyl-CoA thioesterase [Planctomycetota bacterium]|nr:acyl-CoA thioesterase [Planctomycetota bacterium]
MNQQAFPFPKDQQPSIRRVMMPRDTNAMGTIFGGVILSEIDLAAAIEAHQYHPDKIVTIAMDQIVFSEPVFVGDLVSFFTNTVRVGRTSITVGVSVWAQRARDRTQTVHVTEAKVTMVAVDAQMQPIPVSRPRG